MILYNTFNLKYGISASWFKCFCIAVMRISSYILPNKKTLLK